jgi:ATP-dependent protease HslVU (ClpYQ) peptidase subunit
VTCVVGLVDSGQIHMGADSAGVAGWFSVARADEKVFINGQFLMGFTDSFRMGQLLRYSLVPPERHADVPVFRYMVTAFVDAVRTCLKAGGFAEKDKERESAGTFLVGFEGRLFEMSNDYQVGENTHGYAAVGCGRELAMGSLHSTQGRGPRERVLMALAAAAEFNGGVRPPFVVLDL